MLNVQKFKLNSFLNFSSKYKFLVLLIVTIFCNQSVSGQTFEAKGRPIIDFNGEFYRNFYPMEIKGLDTLSSNFGLEKVCINIQHTRVSDLKVELMAPNGTSIWLTNRNGGENGQNYLNTCFESDGFNGYIFEGSAPFGGEYIPDGRMGIFNTGVNPNGTWFLIIRDLAEGEKGRLNSWQMTFGNNPAQENESLCNENNAGSCLCPSNESHCELLPDLIVSYKISNNHNALYGNKHKRYAKQIRLAAALANTGDGPLEFISTDKWFCGSDPVEGSIVCPNGEYSRRVVQQKIHVKNDSSFQYIYREAGTVYYSDEPGHDHFHADDWVEFKLLKKVWYSKKMKLIKTGNKISYCLFDSGNCTEENEFCQNDTIGFFGKENLNNYGFGTFNGCDSDRQGISVGGLDYYGLDFEGQFIQLDKVPKRGSYFVVITVDPTNKFKEKNEDNNSIIIPINLDARN